MIHISVSGADIVTARMPYPHEQKSMGIGWVPVLVITRQGGARELYDATKHVAICVDGRCSAGSEPYRCILTAGHPGAHDPGPDPEGHGPDCGCRYCSGEPGDLWAEPAVTEFGERAASVYRADGPEPDPF